MVEETAAERRLRLVGKGWIGVDLDGTLAEYHKWVAWNSFGKPIPAMVERVRCWIADGHDIRIVTARVGLPVHDSSGITYVCGDDRARCHVTGVMFSDVMMVRAIQDWCSEHVGAELPVQCYKDVHMIELWDDRAVQVVPNTGRTLAEEHEAELSALRGKAQGSAPNYEGYGDD